ncbi:uncharacterized protein OCT59_011835 [Rhizophagus irregularis]|uniref:uncharacterized protein n=1 Tax=Rhizophagus irregularis TaxID=588596 RepID=UPI00332BD43D|nr:hypothetical protein OCT59_011835 [Rhizophagus irregularis]
MDQQFEEEENQKCVQCKQEDTDFLYCETCREHKHKRCTECLQVYTGRKWCQSCNSKRFQQNFDNWTSEFINEITFYIRTRSIFYGITQDPNTKDYVLIMSYAKENWFRNPELSKMNLDWSLQMWRRKIDTLQCFKNYFRCEEKKTELIKTELIEQIEEMNSSPLPDNSSLTNTMHPEAIYKSRPFNFKNLPEPKNSDDYYETFDDISNMKYSEG